MSTKNGTTETGTGAATGSDLKVTDLQDIIGKMKADETAKLEAEVSFEKNRNEAISMVTAFAATLRLNVSPMDETITEEAPIRRGRKPGSKNKAGGHVGRPKGSKNKATKAAAKTAKAPKAAKTPKAGKHPHGWNTDTTYDVIGKIGPNVRFSSIAEYALKHHGMAQSAVAGAIQSLKKSERVSYKAGETRNDGTYSVVPV